MAAAFSASVIFSMRLPGSGRKREGRRRGKEAGGDFFHSALAFSASKPEGFPECFFFLLLSFFFF